jgi:hypothetical protein
MARRMSLPRCLLNRLIDLLGLLVPLLMCGGGGYRRVRMRAMPAAMVVASTHPAAIRR